MFAVMSSSKVTIYLAKQKGRDRIISEYSRRLAIAGIYITTPHPSSPAPPYAPESSPAFPWESSYWRYHAKTAGCRQPMRMQRKEIASRLAAYYGLLEYLPLRTVAQPVKARSRSRFRYNARPAYLKPEYSSHHAPDHRPDC